jgi:hypothetical protein
MEDDEWAMLDQQVMGVVLLTLLRTVAHNIVKQKIMAGRMEALSGMYGKTIC